jgi:rubrerythrin
VRLIYTAARHRQQQLRQQAEMAPHDAGRQGLLRIAEEEREVAEHLRRIIQSLGSFAGEVSHAPEQLGALNYWGRLVQVLEAHREAIKALLDEATRITDGQPELADELRAVARLEEGHAVRLRALIAKSDPQALD